jgi:hypothetical protein
MTLIYCYGIIAENNKLIFDKISFQGNKLYTIPFKDILAIVSNVSEEQFSQQEIDKNVKDLQWLTKNAPLHEEIITEIMQKTTILPMKFCTIFNDEEHLKQMLEDRYGDVKYFLHHVDGKVEMSLKIYTNLSKLKEQVRKESLDIQKLEREASFKSPGQAYFVRQKIDVLLKNKVRQQLLIEKQKVMGKVKELAIEIKKNDILARKHTGKDVSQEMVLNLALLVEKDYLNNLNKLINELKEALPSYELELSGPFAAYNFVR